MSAEIMLKIIAFTPGTVIIRKNVCQPSFSSSTIKLMMPCILNNGEECQHYWKNLLKPKPTPNGEECRVGNVGWHEFVSYKMVGPQFEFGLRKRAQLCFWVGTRWQLIIFQWLTYIVHKWLRFISPRCLLAASKEKQTKFWALTLKINWKEHGLFSMVDVFVQTFWELCLNDLWSKSMTAVFENPTGPVKGYS